MSEQEIIQGLLADLAQLREKVAELDDKINDRINSLPYEQGRKYHPASNYVWAADSRLKEAGESLEWLRTQGV